jgi:hypothetical protein
VASLRTFCDQWPNQSGCTYEGGERGHVHDPLEGHIRTEMDLGQSGSVVHCRRQLPKQGEHNGNFDSPDAP